MTYFGRLTDFGSFLGHCRLFERILEKITGKIMQGHTYGAAVLQEYLVGIPTMDWSA